MARAIVLSISDVSESLLESDIRPLCETIVLHCIRLLGRLLSLLIYHLRDLFARFWPNSDQAVTMTSPRDMKKLVSALTSVVLLVFVVSKR